MFDIAFSLCFASGIARPARRLPAAARVQCKAESGRRTPISRPSRRIASRKAQVARQVAYPVGGFALAWAIFPSLINSVHRVIGLDSSFPSHVSEALKGSFLPLISLVLATLVSVTVSTLRQRQEDIRYLMYEELALVRTVAALVQDEDALLELRKYLVCLNTETFTRGTLARPDIIAVQIRADDILDRTIQKAAFLSDTVSSSLMQMTALRSRRRAVLETGFPAIHYGIMVFLGLCGMGTFAIDCASTITATISLPVRTGFGLLGCVGAWVSILTADLADPFAGIYSMDQEKVFRSVVRIDQKLQSIARL